jgi:hypothetical protein
MQQVLSHGASVAQHAATRVSSQRHTAAAFKPAVKGNKVLAPRRFSAAVCASAAPATTAQASPFAAVDSEAALFAILKAGAAGGKVLIIHVAMKSFAKRIIVHLHSSPRKF